MAIRSGEGRLGRILGLAVLLLALGGMAAMMAASTPDPREALLRYVLGALVVLAVAPAHMLLPDPLISWLQRLNPSPSRLLRRAHGRWAGALIAATLPAAVVAVDGGAWVAGIEAVLLILGVALYAFQNTLSLGPISQEWQEGRRGRLYRELVRRDPRLSLQVPHGMVPAMLASMRVFAVGFVFVLISVAAVAFLGPVGGWLSGGALVTWSVGRLGRMSGVFDRAYYHTSALYSELLHSAGLQVGSRPDLEFDAVYWVPQRWRPHAWAGLVQLDRRLPLGRLFALGAIALWALLAIGAETEVIALFLAIMLLARNASILRHSQGDVAPAAFNLALQSMMDWGLTRFWMNVRWTLPLALVLSVTAIFSRSFSWGDVLLWSAVDVGLAAITAIAATLLAEWRYLRKFA